MSSARGRDDTSSQSASDGDSSSGQSALDEDQSLVRFLDRYWPRSKAAAASVKPSEADGASSDRFSESDAAGEIGRFKIRRELGRGGFASVYLAHDPLRGCDVALKVPHPEIRHSPELRLRFQREARAAASLDHPNINAIYETSPSATPDLYLSSHYCPGPTLAGWLKRRIAPVSPESAARLMILISGAVQHAHERGILHRDLKPGNVLLERLEPPFAPGVEETSFEGHFPRLCDFGLAKILDDNPDDARTRTGILLGTPRYMAPEQAAGQSLRVGPRTDIYSLGVILYELLAGRPPFVADTDLETLRQVRSEEPVSVRRLQPRVPRDLDTICMKCLEKEPERRYATAGELAADLSRFLGRLPIAAKPISAARRLRVWTQRHPVQALVLLAGMIVLVGLPAGLAWHNARLERAFRVADDERIRALDFEAQARANEQAALAKEANVQQHVYASDMRLASELLKEGEFAAVSALVDRHEPSRESPVDRRGFEWRYLRRIRDIQRRTWQAHPGELNMLAFSADGGTLMTGSYADQSAKTWDLPSGKLLATFPTRKWDETRDRDPGALSPDGRMAVTLVNENCADLFDARTGKKIFRLKHPGKIFCTSFSPDGRYLVTAAESGTYVWLCGTWDKPRNEFGGSRLAVFSPDSQFLATAWNPTYSTNLRILDLPRLTVKKTLEFWFPVLEVAYSPDGRKMATVCDGQYGTEISLYDVEMNAWERSVALNQTYLHHIAFSADSKLLGASTREGSLHLWDLDIRQPIASYRGGTSRISRFQFSPDGRTLATSTDRGSVSLCDVALFAGPEPVNGRSLACPGHVAFDARSKRVAVGVRDHSVSLFNASTGQLDCHLRGNWEAVGDIAFSPDGGHVVTVDLRHIRCWDTTNGRQIWQCESPGVHSVAWSPLGSVLATGGLDHQVRLFDAMTGKQTALLQGHTREVLCVRFFPDGNRLASAGYDLTVRIWDIASRRTIKTLSHKVPPLSLAIPPDGRELAVGLPLGKLALWSLSESKSPEAREVSWSSRYKAWFAGQEPAVAYSPDGSLLGEAGPGGVFRATRRATGELVFALSGVGVDPMSAAWSPNGSLLATVSGSNDVMLWDTATWHGHRAFGGPLAVVRSLAYCDDGKMLAVATDRAAGLESSRSDAPRSGPNIRLADQLPRTGSPGSGPSIKRQVTEARDYIPWQSTNDTLRFWGVASSTERSLLVSLPTLSALLAVACSRKQKLLAGASCDGSLWIWHTGTHELLAHLFLDESIRNQIDAASSRSPALVPQEALRKDAAAHLLAFSPNGAQLAACDQTGTVRFWDTRDWHELPSLNGEHGQPKVLVYSRDGSILAVNNRGQIKLYDPRSAAALAAIGTAAAADICCGQFSPDGASLTVGTRDGSIRFINTQSHRTDATLVGHGDAVVSLDFAPDGRTLATGSWDATVRLWDVASKREVAVLEGHRGRVHAVAFSPDGATLASGGEIDDSPEQGLGELFLWRAAR